MEKWSCCLLKKIERGAGWIWEKRFNQANLGIPITYSMWRVSSGYT